MYATPSNYIHYKYPLIWENKSGVYFIKKFMSISKQ